MKISDILTSKGDQSRSMTPVTLSFTLAKLKSDRLIEKRRREYLKRYHRRIERTRIEPPLPDRSRFDRREGAQQ